MEHLLKKKLAKALQKAHLQRVQAEHTHSHAFYQFTTTQSTSLSTHKDTPLPNQLSHLTSAIFTPTLPYRHYSKKHLLKFKQSNQIYEKSSIKNNVSGIINKIEQGQYIYCMNKSKTDNNEQYNSGNKKICKIKQEKGNKKKINRYQVMTKGQLNMKRIQKNHHQKQNNFDINQFLEEEVQLKSKQKIKQKRHTSSSSSRRQVYSYKIAANNKLKKSQKYEDFVLKSRNNKNYINEIIKTVEQEHRLINMQTKNRTVLNCAMLNDVVNWEKFENDIRRVGVRGQRQQRIGKVGRKNTKEICSQQNKEYHKNVTESNEKRTLQSTKSSKSSRYCLNHHNNSLKSNIKPTIYQFSLNSSPNYMQILKKDQPFRFQRTSAPKKSHQKYSIQKQNWSLLRFQQFRENFQKEIKEHERIIMKSTVNNVHGKVQKNIKNQQHSLNPTKNSSHNPKSNIILDYCDNI